MCISYQIRDKSNLYRFENDDDIAFWNATVYLNFCKVKPMTPEEKLKKYLIENGLKTTKQRNRILDIFLKKDRHMTSDELLGFPWDSLGFLWILLGILRDSRRLIGREREWTDWTDGRTNGLSL